ncbi:MAG: transcription termination factor Rho, partial [Actinobacteria bacterium]|nr:transcription termination factor Rho [Actinomycetota bacterium]
MSAEQPSRSLLERKERDELKAIAQSLGLEPASRTTKASLIGQILKATGVEDSAANGAPKANGDKPKRTRAAKTKTDESTEASEQNAEKADTGSESATPASAETSSDSSESNGSSSTSTSTDTSTDSGDGDGGQRDRGDRGDRGPRDRGNRQGQGQGQGRWSNDGDPGNRRSRRRRGRDRDRGPGGGGGDRSERDLQGHGQEVAYSGEPLPVEGLLDLRDEGYGFVRTRGYLPGSSDVYVSMSQVRRFALRKGDHIAGTSRPAASSEKYPALLQVDQVNAMDPEEARKRPRFEDLTPLFPDSRLRLETPGDPSNITGRIVDMISPIGKGQRGLIVSPSKAGKTTVLKQIAHSIEANNPEVHLIVLLVDERPEEVTDMRRSVKGEVVASTFDRPPDEHTAISELTIARGKRLVELGKDVVIVLDGITRLARAYNLAAPATGRIMSGGIDTGALYPPKKFLGAARNVEEG